MGVAHPWCGRLGKSANCQVGVFLTGITPGGTAFQDSQLFLTKERAADKAHRKKTRVPREVKFQTKAEIAIDMLRRTLAAGKVHFDWITADSWVVQAAVLAYQEQTVPGKAVPAALLGLDRFQSYAITRSSSAIARLVLPSRS